MVSIIVPVYNSGKYIDETICSVLAQTFEDWELILVDDCSTDDSVKHIEAYSDPRIRLVRLPQNRGAAGARNVGLNEASGRYIAYLDADDIWMPDKLEYQLKYMGKYNTGFVFSSYAFGNEKAEPNGKITRVPKTIHYKRALSRTIIFTSTVLIDTQKIDKSLLEMPSIPSEDSATWWRILKTGIIAYGLDLPLVIYRRPASSLSSNKLQAIKRIWNLYRNCEGLNVFSSFTYLFLWAMRSTFRRIVYDTFRRHMETVKRFTVIQMSLMGLLINCAMYAYIWHYKYYPIISSIRISQDGYVFGAGIKLYFRGHLLIVLVYFLILLFCSRNSDGMRTGFVKPVSVFSAQAGALVITNIITYFQISIMRNWLVEPWPMFVMFAFQILFSLGWSFAADTIYRKVFPARETLIISSSDNDASRVLGIMEKRDDMFHVMKSMKICEGIDRIEKECLLWYGGVVLVNLPSSQEKHLIEFCYRHYIRVFLMPDISDILIQGSWQLDLFGTSLLEIKEFSINSEQRICKRVADILLSSVLLFFLLPLIMIKRLMGVKIISERCVGRGKKEFNRYQFEGNGFGKRIPSMFNVLKGDMSLVGTFPYSVSKALELVNEDCSYNYIHRVKPGVTGYSIQRCEEYSTDKDLLLLDMYYIQNYSLMFDIKLILQALTKNVFKRHIIPDLDMVNNGADDK